MASTTFNTLRPEDMILHSRALGASVRPTAYHPKWNSDIQHLARDVQSFVGGPAFQHLLRSKLADEGYVDATESHNFFDDKRITVHLTAGSIDVEVEGLPGQTHALALCLLDHGGLNLDDHIEAIDKEVTMRTQAAYEGHAQPQYTRLMQEHDTRYRKPHLIPLMKDIHRIFGPTDELATSFGLHQTPPAQADHLENIVHPIRRALSDSSLSDYGTGSDSGQSVDGRRASPLSEADSTSLLKIISGMHKELKAEQTGRKKAEAQLNDALRSLRTKNETITHLKDELKAAQIQLKQAQENRDKALTSIHNLKDQLRSATFKADSAESRADHAEEDATALREQTASLIANYHTAQELLTDAKAALEEVRAENRALTQEVTSLRDTVKQTNRALAKKGAALDALTQRNKDLQADIGRFDERVDDLKLQLTQAKRLSKRAFTNYQMQLFELEHQLKIAQVERDEVQHQLRSAKDAHSDMAADVEKLKSAHAEQAQALANKEKALSATQSNLEKAQISLASALKDKDALKAEVSGLKSQLISSTASIHTLKSTLDEQTASKAKALADIDRATSTISALEDQNSSLDDQLQVATAQLEQAQASYDEALSENEDQGHALAEVTSALSEAKANLQATAQKLSASTTALEKAHAEKMIALEKASEAQALITGLQEALDVEGINYKQLIAAFRKLLTETEQKAREAQDNYAASEALAHQRGQKITHLESEIVTLKRMLKAKKEPITLVQGTPPNTDPLPLTEITKLQDRIALLENQLADAKKALQTEKTTSTDLLVNLEDALDIIETLTSEKNALQKDLTSAHQKLSKLQEIHNAEFTALQDDMSQELEIASQKAKKQDALLSTLDQETASLRRELTRLKAAPSQTDDEMFAQIHTLQQALGRSEEQRALAEEDRREAIAQHEALAAKSIELFKRYEAQKAALAEKEEQIIALTESAEAYKSAAQQSAEKLQEALASKESFIQETRERIQELDSDLKAAQYNYDQTLNEKEVLENSYRTLNDEKNKAVQQLEEANTLIQQLQHEDPLVVTSREQSETIAQLERTIANSEAQSKELLGKINQLKDKESEFLATLASNAKTIKEQSEEIAFRDETIGVLEKQLKKAETDAKTSEQRHRLALDELASEFNSEMIEMGQRLESARKDIGRLAEKNTTLEAELIQAYAAKFEAIKELDELQDTETALQRIELGDANLKSEILKLKTLLAQRALEVTQKDVLLKEKARALDFAQKQIARLEKDNSTLSERLNKHISLT